MKIFQLTFHHNIFKSNIHLWCNFAKTSKHKFYYCYHCVSLYNGALVCDMTIFKLNNICCCHLPYALWLTSKIKWTMRKLETALPQVENLTIKLFFFSVLDTEGDLCPHLFFYTTTFSQCCQNSNKKLGFFWTLEYPLQYIARHLDNWLYLVSVAIKLIWRNTLSISKLSLSFTCKDKHD